MSNFLNILIHDHKLNHALSSLPLDELKSIYNKLEQIIAHREMQNSDNKVDRNEHIKSIRKQMSKLGLSINDVGAAIKAPKPLIKKKVQI